MVFNGYLRTIDKWVLMGWLAFFILCACAKTVDPVPSWNFGDKAVQITYTADKLLNSYDNKPRTLLLVVYQLDNVNAFNRFSAYKEGLEKLLEAQNFDPSVMAVEKAFVEPASTKTLVLNRAENAKWVGVVAGYFDLIPDKASRVFEIPHSVKTTGAVFKKREAQIEALRVHLLLGPNTIQEIKSP